MLAVQNALTRDIPKWLDTHPKVNTVVVVANHVFRAISMYALMQVLPGSFVAKCAVTLAASAFYRVTIERFCHFRFALLSCAGGIALKLSMPTLLKLSASSSAASLAGALPAALYLGAAFYVSREAVRQLNAPNEPAGSCCSAKPVASCCSAKAETV